MGVYFYANNKLIGTFRLQNSYIVYERKKIRPFADIPTYINYDRPSLTSI